MTILVLIIITNIKLGYIPFIALQHEKGFSELPNLDEGLRAQLPAHDPKVSSSNLAPAAHLRDLVWSFRGEGFLSSSFVYRYSFKATTTMNSLSNDIILESPTKVPSDPIVPIFSILNPAFSNMPS